jgi:predicted transcriptional regulator
MDNYISAGAITALAGLSAALAAAYVRLRNSKHVVNLAEDRELNRRVSRQMTKYELRQDILEKRVDAVVSELLECEKHRAKCEADCQWLRNEVQRLSGIVNGGS